MTKKYNEIEAKNNMKVETEGVEVDVEVSVEPTEKKQIERVVSVQPKKVKRSLLGRLVSGIMGPEGLPSIGTYVNDEIIKPAVKNIIFDAITSGLGRALNMDYRQPRGGNSRNGGPSRQPTNYSNRFNNSRPSDVIQHDERKVARPARYGVEEYIIPDRYDAANVLTSLQEYADRYDRVSIADYYELIGVISDQFTDNNYGWSIESISRASIMPVRGGYIIKFPPVEVI